MKNLPYFTDTKISYKIIIENYFCTNTFIPKKTDQFSKKTDLLFEMCESWLGAMRAPSSAQSCDSTSRLGVEAIAHLDLHLDKRQIKEDPLTIFSIHNVQSTFQLFSFGKPLKSSYCLEYPISLRKILKKELIKNCSKI